MKDIDLAPVGQLMREERAIVWVAGAPDTLLNWMYSTPVAVASTPCVFEEAQRILDPWLLVITWRLVRFITGRSERLGCFRKLQLGFSEANARTISGDSVGARARVGESGLPKVNTGFG